MKLLDGVTAAASVSPCGLYRYALTRDWEPADDTRRVLWIMLNPSIADGDQDDATLRKIQKYSSAWGFSALTVVNVFALRATKPDVLRHHRDPIGPENDDILAAHIGSSDVFRIVAGWGAHGWLHNRGLIVNAVLERAGVTVHRLGPLTKGGHPGHPLYLDDDLEPEIHLAGGA